MCVCIYISLCMYVSKYAFLYLYVCISVFYIVGLCTLVCMCMCVTVCCACVSVHMSVHVCLYLCIHIHAIVCVEVWVYLARVHSLHPPCGILGLNSGQQDWQQAPFIHWAILLALVQPSVTDSHPSLHSLSLDRHVHNSKWKKWNIKMRKPYLGQQMWKFSVKIFPIFHLKISLKIIDTHGPHTCFFPQLVKI